MISAPPIEAIVIAAGSSRRMGGVNKLLLPVAGVALVRRSVMLYAGLASPVTVVVGHQRDRVVAALAGLDLRIVDNADGGPDQQQSVALGLSAAELAGRGLLVALADQPLLEPADIEALIAFFDAEGGEKICIPAHHGDRGNPVLFPAAIARRLRDEGGGARRFIDAHPDRVAWFAAGNDHFTADVDTPADAERLLGR